MNASSRSILAQGFDACVGIVRFRKGPEDVPASSTLLAAAIVGGVLMRVVLLAIPAPESAGNPAVLIPLEIGISLLGTLLVLRMAGHPERFQQTATALFGCQLVLAPALFVARWLLFTYYDQPGMGSVGRLAYFIVAVWLLSVSVRILRSATQWPIVACVLAALTIEVLTVLAALTLYPPAETAATAT